MYSRDQLLFLGSSPICRTPPSGMAAIPGINAPGKIETVGSPLPSVNVTDLLTYHFLCSLNQHAEKRLPRRRNLPWQVCVIFRVAVCVDLEQQHALKNTHTNNMGHRTSYR